MYKYAIIIPYYNHPEKIKELCDKLSKYKIHILIVNDGSNEQSSKVLNDILHVEILNLSKNSGKGYALKKGFEHLMQNGFTHALQIDADFQHNTEDVEKFLQKSKQNPNSYVCGSPIYSLDAPKSRLYGRKITNFWIFINTLGGIKNDGMCGFRLYPLDTIKHALSQTKANKMDYDTEILVRAFWDNVHITWIKTNVRYNCDTSSHFRALEDNLLISKMHARMFFYMIYKLFRGKNV
ncbi:MAG: glycosyltransferase family 2 protein [Arcobacter sp.]|nr:glycosyltransferase family 2 protein [Arcobacter sp.]